MQRHMLFLQGLPGPFFSHLAHVLRAKGHKVSRIHFNAGDALDWRAGSAVSYRGLTQDWPKFLKEFVDHHHVTDIIGFGACRPMHRVAIDLARQQSLGVFMFDEGYLRPHHVTMIWHDHEGRQPVLPSDWSDKMHADLIENHNFKSHFGKRMREAVFYGCAAMIGSARYPYYESHRFYSSIVEMQGWCKRWLRKNRETRASTLALHALNTRDFFLFPLQLDGDAQLVFRSPFDSMMHAVDHTLASFATHAPRGSHMLIKRHPLDPDIHPWRTRIEKAVAGYQLEGRVHYVERADLDSLIMTCCGVVTVNSSVGLQALAMGRPVHVLGEAVYDVEPLVHNRALEEFWANPTAPVQEHYVKFARALETSCQVNGGFHDKVALAALVHNVADRLIKLDHHGRMAMRQSMLG
jgi:capsular polysaccharide export protein